MRMNPPIIHCSKVNEDSQVFLDGVYNVLSAMEYMFRENAEFGSYLLKDVCKI